MNDNKVLNIGGFDETHIVCNLEQFNKLLNDGGYQALTQEEFEEVGYWYDEAKNLRVFFDGE